MIKSFGGFGRQATARSLAACIAAAFFLLAACATTPKQTRETAKGATVVLLPDDQGKTGSIVVSGAGGNQVLSAPRQGVRVSAGEQPGQPYIVKENDLQSQVGPALKALPPPPINFILYFRWNSDDLTRESATRISEILQRIKERTPVDISVVGHTDTVGEKDYNCRLSLRRAKAVAALLARKGVDPAILDITSHGKNNPLIPTGDQVPEPRNRRVEVTVR